MRALPDSPGVQTVFLVITVANSDDAHQGRAQHQSGIAILRDLRRNPAIHPPRHNLISRSRERRLSECIDGKAVTKFLDLTPTVSNPPPAAMLDLRIGIDDVV